MTELNMTMVMDTWTGDMTMNERLIGSADFKANCLKIIDQINKDKQPVTITRRGNPVARLSPVDGRDAKASIIGAMKGPYCAMTIRFLPPPSHPIGMLRVDRPRHARSGLDG